MVCLEFYQWIGVSIVTHVDPVVHLLQHNVSLWGVKNKRLARSVVVVSGCLISMDC